MEMESTLRRLSQEPALWDTLHESGFFLANFVDGFFRLSRVLQDLGYRKDGWGSGSFFRWVHPDDRVRCRELWDHLEAGVDGFDVEYRILDRESNAWAWVQSHGVVASRQAGKVAVFLGFDQNISGRKRAEEGLRQQLADAEAVFHQSESLRVASMLANSGLDLEKTLHLVLTQAQGLLPFQKAAVSTFDAGAFHLLGVHTLPDEPVGIPEKPDHHPAWAVVAHQVPGVHDDLGLLDPPFPGDPDRRYRSWLGIPLIFQGELLGALEFWHQHTGAFGSDQLWPAMGFADSVAEAVFNSRKFQALQEDARTDPLTGLFTRRQLQVSGPEVIEASFAEGRPLAVLLLDIDHFKSINDTYGHLVGDAVLMTLAQGCRSLLRKADLFFRFGGEEFIVILPDTEPGVAERIAERLRETVAVTPFPGARDITASIGVAPVAAGNRVVWEEVLEEADQAMYQAKEQGRDRVVCSARWTEAVGI